MFKRAPRSLTVSIILVLALLTSPVLTGCSTSAQPHSFAFVVGDRSNSAGPDAVALATSIPIDVAAGSVLSVTGVSGSPDGVTGITTTIPQGADEDAILRARSSVRASIGKVRATAPEADVLGAIAAGARTIKGTPGAKTIEVWDSLVSTTGALGLQGGLLSEAPEDVVASISSKDLPDLKGMAVIIHPAETTLPQQPLPTRDLTTLDAIYQAVLKKAGAKSVVFQNSDRTTTVTRSAPRVTPVAPSTVQSPVVSGCTATIPQYLIQFAPGSSHFLSSASAKQQIARVVTALKDCTGQVTITGTAATSGTQSAATQVSLGRANAVRAIWAQLAEVAPDTIKTAGLGYEFAWKVTDTTASGALIESAAEQNRAVRISYAG